MAAFQGALRLYKTKTISEISGTTKKPFTSKKVRAMHVRSSLRSAQMRGGATIFGPVVRSHEVGMPKKVRKLALAKTALSAKAGRKARCSSSTARSSKPLKPRELVAIFKKIGWDAPRWIIDGPQVNEAFAKAARNIMFVDVLPQQGANVYDILRHKQLVLTKDAVTHLEERLK